MDEDDTIHLMWQFGFKNGHMERNAQVIYNHLTRRAGPTMWRPGGFAAIPPPTAPGRARRGARLAGQERLRNLSVYFGDIHGQSGLSDGMGGGPVLSPGPGQGPSDFTALTDHDCYPGS